MCVWSKRKLYMLSIKNYKNVVNYNTSANFKRKKFNEIPGPISIPVIGTLYQYLPVVGK